MGVLEDANRHWTLWSFAVFPKIWGWPAGVPCSFQRLTFWSVWPLLGFPRFTTFAPKAGSSEWSPCEDGGCLAAPRDEIKWGITRRCSTCQHPARFLWIVRRSTSPTHCSLITMASMSFLATCERNWEWWNSIFTVFSIPGAFLARRL